MTHASEIIELISRNGYTYVEVPVTIDYTDYSTQPRASRVLNAVNIAFDTLLRQGEQPMILVQLLLDRSPLRLHRRARTAQPAPPTA